jgi:hypothetical protein
METLLSFSFPQLKRQRTREKEREREREAGEKAGDGENERDYVKRFSELDAAVAMGMGKKERERLMWEKTEFLPLRPLMLKAPSIVHMQAFPTMGEASHRI